MSRISNFVLCVVHMASSISEQSSKSEIVHGTSKHPGSAILRLFETADTSSKAHEVNRLDILASLDNPSRRSRSWTCRCLAIHGSSHRRTGLSFRVTGKTALDFDATGVVLISHERSSTPLMALGGATNGLMLLVRRRRRRATFESWKGHQWGRWGL